MLKTYSKIQDISHHVTSNQLKMRKKHAIKIEEVRGKIKVGEKSLSKKIDTFDKKYGRFF
ncbi:TPA: hypothetical protein U1278_000247 [Streptococcus suis]|nr:hypothetical protein [Streptococcus suis]